jgi:hypothetical protein
MLIPGVAHRADRIEGERGSVEPLEDFLAARPALIDVPVADYIRRIETLPLSERSHTRAHGQRCAAVRV